MHCQLEQTVQTSIQTWSCVRKITRFEMKFKITLSGIFTQAIIWHLQYGVVGIGWLGTVCDSSYGYRSNINEYFFTDSQTGQVWRVSQLKHRNLTKNIQTYLPSQQGETFETLNFELKKSLDRCPRDWSQLGYESRLHFYWWPKGWLPKSSLHQHRRNHGLQSAHIFSVMKYFSECLL